MNRANIRAALADFVQSDELQTAALSGGWGVGKTYLWRQFAESLVVPDAFNGISYASLFGVSSIAELRSKVTEGLALTQDRDTVVQKYKESSKKSLIPRELPAKTVGWIQRLLSDGFSGVFAEAAYWFVRDCIVCLDDIERCGQDIDARTIMGFVDELRNRGCKIVMILNREELRADDDAIKLYWEKVIDIDLQLSPSVEQNAAIIFGPDFNPPEYAEWVRAVFRSMGCNNIRIHRRAAWLVRRIAPLLGGLRESLQREAVEHAALLSWALLDPNVEVSPEVMGSPKYGSLWVAVISQGDARDRLSPEEEEWAKIVERTGYSPASFDRFLASLVTSGWCDDEEFAAALERTNLEETGELARQRLYEVYRVYKEAFGIDREQYIGLLRGVLEEEMANLSVFDFDSGISSLALLNHDATDLAERYVALRADHLQAVAEARHRDHNPENPVLLTEIERREAEFRENQFTIDSVAHHLATEDSWGGDQIEFLASRPPADYEAWILSEPDNLARKIRAILKFRGNNQGQYVNAVQNLETSLRTIAGQSDFHALRIWRAYGVTIADGD